MNTIKNARLVRLFKGLCLLSILTLTGCETGKSPQEKAPVPVATAGSNANNEKVIQAVPAEPQIDYATLNPVCLTFDKSSAELSDNNKKILATITERAKQAHHITITGFCDRNQFANAREAAIKRALVVKEALMHLGVASPMQIKYETTEANKHAVEIRF